MMKTRNARVSLWLLPLFALACGKTESRTDIVLEIQSNLLIPEEMNALGLQVGTDASSSFFSQTYPLGPGKTQLPASVTLVPTANETQITLILSGLLDGTTVISRTVSTGFVKGASKYLRVDLNRECLGNLTCPSHESCGEGGICRNNILDPRKLPDFSPSQAKPTPLPRDGGVASPMDGALPDGPGNGIEAGGNPDVPATKAAGTACTSSLECKTGYCSDGVCCESECKDICRACNLVGQAGRCSLAAPGTDPRENCSRDDERTCKNTGSCDGKGACQKHLAGTECFPPACSSFVRATASRCDGLGNCLRGPTLSCIPFVCDESSSQGDCQTTCQGEGSCLTPATCQNGSCGKKPLGAICVQGTDCHSGFCADGVCCQSACADSCRSCAVAGSQGACIPTPAGKADPKGLCKAETGSPCGGDGTCDGTGRCQKAPMGTSCAEATCAGSLAVAPKFCDGQGACLASSQQSCDPYGCSGASCKGTCGNDADCAEGAKCQGGECVGKKGDGLPCASAIECKSGICSDGICCKTACDSPCASCGVTGRLGTCTPLPERSQPKNDACPKQDPATCGTDGTCDGIGACRLYGGDTVCKPSVCSQATKTLASTCDGKRQCVTQGTLPCAPFQCGETDCLGKCTTDADCIAPNPCVAGSCGKKPVGGTCLEAADCQTGICAQGFCCNSTCDGACKTCALAGSEGTCRPIPAGLPDPKNTCIKAATPETCGFDGTCDGAGACHYYEGNACGAPTCQGSDLLQAGTCSKNQCLAPPAIRCAPYGCDAVAGRCKSQCVTNADCDSAAFCRSGICVPKLKLGQGCEKAAECETGLCVDGVCCDSACQSSCHSCRVSGLLGKCSPIPSGSSSEGECPDEGVQTCGRNGKCNGQGACQLYGSGLVCTPSTCPTGSSTHQLASLCDGAGHCMQGAAQSCAPYLCNAAINDCYSACSPSSAECLPPNLCVGGSCGKKSNGQTCTSPNECSSNFCEQGVCCSGSCRDSCKSCGLSGSLGTCSLVPVSQPDPQFICKDEGVASCGSTGLCDGAGSCQKYASGLQCASVCTAATATYTLSTCNGTGSCVPTSTLPCSPYSCDASGCKLSCTSNTDCAQGFLCTAGRCVRPPENCENGVDDDGDTRVDCADTDCQAGYLCVPDFPSGFKGPAAVFDGPSNTDVKCTAAYPTPTFDMFGNPSCDFSCSGCGCGKPSDSTCEKPHFYSNSLIARACTNGPNPINPGVCTPIVTETSSMQVSGGTPTGGSCPASGGTISAAPITWNNRGLVCGRDGSFGGGCAKGFTCAARPSAPFLASPCVYAEGDTVCPATGYSAKRTIWSDKEAKDTRECKDDCGCGSPAGVTCPGTIDFYNSSKLFSCITRTDSMKVPLACTLLPTSATAFIYTPATPTGGSCAVTGNVTKLGGCIPISKPVTLCCTP